MLMTPFVSHLCDFSFKNYLFIYLPVLGLGCGMQALWSLLYGVWDL